MPIKIVTKVWACDICRKEFPKKKQAKYCESLGKQALKYKKGDVLTYLENKIVIRGHFFRFMKGAGARKDQHVLYYYINRNDQPRTTIAQSTLDELIGGSWGLNSES